MGSFTGDLHITDQTVHLPPSLDGLDPEIYVTLEPSLPDRSTLGVPPSAPNPFMDDAESRIPTIDKLRVFTPRNGEINGYLKVRIHLQGLREEQASPRPLCRQTGKRKRLEEDDEQPLAQSDIEREMVRALAVGKESGFLNNPPNFGLNCKLSLVERKIFRFCKSPSQPTKSTHLTSIQTQMPGAVVGPSSTIPTRGRSTSARCCQLANR